MNTEKVIIKQGFENMDVEAVHRFLNKESYWAKGIPLETVRKSLENSFCIGLFDNGKQIGFSRLVTDYATFGYLADVYILEKYRGIGLSKMMMKYTMELDFVQRFRRTLLATLDAHRLYSRFGFRLLENPDIFMEINKHEIYEVDNITI